MKDTSLTPALELFFEQNAHLSTLKGRDSFNSLVDSVDKITRALNKFYFVENLKEELEEYELSSIHMGYDYGSDDEGGTYVYYFIESAVMMDGSDGDTDAFDADDLRDSLNLNLLDDDLFQGLISKNLIDAKRLDEITAYLITGEDKDIIDYFKVRQEQKSLNEATPSGEKVKKEALKV